MSSLGKSIGILFVIAAIGAGCQNKLHDENVALWKQNNQLQADLTDARNRLQQAPDPTALVSLQTNVQGMQGEIAARDAKIRELESQLRQPAGGSDPGIAGIETTYDRAAGTMTVNVPGDVLFDSGKDVLKPGSRSTLDKIVAALKKDYAGKPIRVEGHTDADKITRSAAVYRDNLDLSLNRAAAVTRYLEERGVDPKSVVTSGFGETKPRGSEKSKNRRVEIVVVVR